MTNRVHIDAPAGIIDIEGEKDFVEGLLAKLFPLIEEAGFGSRPQGLASGLDDEVPANAPLIAEVPASDDLTTKLKPKKRRTSAPPPGQSCAARILVLKQEDFFKGHHRSVSEIVSGLAAKGWTHKSNQVGASLTQMFGKGDIQRTKEGNGSWKYFWDRS